MPRPGIPGGPQGHLPYLVHGLRGRGLEVREELYGNPDGRRSFVGRAGFVLDTARRLRAAMHEAAREGRRFDVVHLNTAFDRNALLRDVTVVSALKRSGERIVLKFHGSDAALAATRDPLLHRLIRRLITRVDAFGVLSSEERNTLLAAGFPPENVRVVKNILRPDLYLPDPDFRRKEGLPGQKPVILFAARFLREKGILDVIEACALLQTRHEPFILIAAGDGPLRQEVEAAVRERGLADVVRLTGQIPEERMRALYANATVLAFPTYHQEGFPMVVFQSVAAGLPVITTRIRAAADYLNEPENCLWVEPRNPRQLADRLEFLLRHPAERKNMSQCNRNLAFRFKEDVVTEEYVRLYDDLVGRG
ncbi:MAG TPA: glycosyltransferase family 4 protein [Bacteroidota bacterium]